MKRTTISVIALTLCVLFAASCFAACGSGGKTALIGSWESIEAPGTVYTFNEDGTGTLDASGAVMNFTYTDKDGKLDITYEGASAPQTSTYTIKDGVLSITDNATQNTLTYNKK